MRRIIMSEAQYEAIKFAVNDTAEVYSQFKGINEENDPDEEEYAKQVRKHGQVLTELSNDQFRD